MLYIKKRQIKNIFIATACITMAMLLAACPNPAGDDSDASIAVTAVTLNITEIWLVENETVQLTATISPANATNKAIFWSSSDTAVATVSASGLVTRLAPGTVTITATTADGGKTDFCSVTESGRTFNSYDMENSETYQVSAAKRAEGTYSIVYVDSAVFDSVSAAAASQICSQFDTTIHGLINTNFASERDVDHNGKIILLLLNIRDGFDPATNPGYVAGYFDPTDLFDPETYPESNEADMLYLDVDPAEVGSVDFYNTIAHEFQHLVNFNRTYLTRNFEQDVWINEGLSSAAEYLYQGSQVQSRIEYYNADPMDTIAYGNNFFVWDGYWEQVEGDVLADYSTVYLFFQWLRIQASNGSGIYKDILDQNVGDYRAVTNTAGVRIDSQYATWERLLRDWLLAPLFTSPTGPGYKNQIAVQAHIFTSAGGYKWFFSPGEGIFTATASGTYTPPDTDGPSGLNVRYVGIADNLTLDTTGPDYTGVAMLAFNANSNCEGLDEIGYLSNTLTKLNSFLSQFSRVSNRNAMPSRYAISILKSPGGGLAEDSHKPGKRASKMMGTQFLNKKMVKISE